MARDQQEIAGRGALSPSPILIPLRAREYDGVDLSALDNMTTEQLIQCDRILKAPAACPRLKGAECRVCVHRGCRGHWPAGRVLQYLPAREGARIKTKVGGYFFGSE